ncbi:MAG: class IV adenylate cyclase [Elusimicrobia bacterium]|nr:class IV adenylate cyclase [Elusimicrobiota bacterium]
MPVNIEIKAKAADWDDQLSRAKKLCGVRRELVQEDVFFHCRRGRLKLRVLGKKKESYLIFYQRPDRAGSKRSHFETSPVPDPDSMIKLLSKALGEGKTVKKKRILFLAGRTRIHFDEVEGLGRFIEIEACLRPGQSAKEGKTIAGDWMRRLHIAKTELLQGAYADMLGKKR